MKWFLILLLWGLSSCNFSLNRSRQYSIISPEDSINNISADEFFYINLKSAYYTGEKDTFNPLDFMIYAMDDGPGTDCKISVNQEGSTEDLYCIMEIMEGDLWLHEINLEYNVPPGMCEYLGFLPHWHYNYKSGQGPPFIAQVKPEGEEIEPSFYEACKKTPVPFTYGRCSNKDCDSESSCENPNAPCNGAEAGTWKAGTCSDKSCKTKSSCEDKTHSCKTLCCKTEEQCSSLQNKLIPCEAGTWTEAVCSNTNCKTRSDCESVSHACNSSKKGTWTPKTISVCPEGEVYPENKNAEYADTCPYKSSELSYNTTEGGGDGQSESVVNCCTGNLTLYEDGERKVPDLKWILDTRCIGGLARITWDKKNFKEGFPLTLIEETKGKQFDKEYKIEPLIDKIYLKGGERYSLPTANYFSDIRENSLPDFYKQVNTEDNQGNPFITLSCLDSAYEVKHVIKMIIRDWNTQEEFISFKESNGSRGDPDTNGFEGSDCPYYEQESDSLFSKCNDLKDVDDNGNPYPGLAYKKSGSDSGGDDNSD